MPTEAQLQRLVDKDEIRDVILRYARAVDRGDVELLKTCYHPDATADYGKNSGPHDEIEAHFEAVGRMHDYLEVAHHDIANIVIELDGDFAAVESYLIDTLSQRTGAGLAAGQTIVHQLFARYLDRFEKRNGEWRIIRRVVVKDLRNVSTFVDYHDGYRSGRADCEDLVYDPLRE